MHKDPSAEPYPRKHSYIVTYHSFWISFIVTLHSQVRVASGRLCSSSPTVEEQEKPSVRTGGFRAEVGDRDLLNSKHESCPLDR